MLHLSALKFKYFKFCHVEELLELQTISHYNHHNTTQDAGSVGSKLLAAPQMLCCSSSCWIAYYVTSTIVALTGELLWISSYNHMEEKTQSRYFLFKDRKSRGQVWVWILLHISWRRHAGGRKWFLKNQLYRKGNRFSFMTYLIFKSLQGETREKTTKLGWSCDILTWFE